jgi:uncharacterized protein (DUF58 family)
VKLRSLPPGSWRRTPAWYRALAVGVLAAGVGLATGRPDVVALAAPLLLGRLLSAFAIRPLLGSRVPTAEVHVDEQSFGSNSADVVTEVSGMDGVEFASIAQPGLDSGPVGRMVTVPGGPRTRDVRSRFRTKQWGPTGVARPDLLAAGPDGLYLAGPVRRGPVRTELVLPEVMGIAPLVLPPISGGWAGAHVSRRPGQGSDLVDLREFAPGDRLRSIHWRAYARHQRLYTRRTLSDADAEMMICLDLSAVLEPRRRQPPGGRIAMLAESIRTALRAFADRIAERRGDPGPARRREEERRLRSSSLDLAVAAAAAIAAAHLGQGDRVGLVTASMPRRILRPGAGNRQLQRIRHQLALLENRRYRLIGVPWWGLRPGQSVVFCSPIINQASADAVLDCQTRGHRVIVVDTLPLTGMLRAATLRDADHLRVLTVERELRLDRLRGMGIPVLSWDAGNIGVQMATAVHVMRSRR